MLDENVRIYQPTAFFKAAQIKKDESDFQSFTKYIFTLELHILYLFSIYIIKLVTYLISKKQTNTE